jgi:hypothetical protein
MAFIGTLRLSPFLVYAVCMVINESVKIEGKDSGRDLSTFSQGQEIVSFAGT